MKTRWTLALVILLTALLLPLAAAAGRGSVPEAAESIIAQMDPQMLTRLAGVEGTRGDVSIAVTVPVNLTDFEASSPLARQMAEEIASALVNTGYRVQEIRKGREVVFRPDGEMLLTRKVDQLASTTVNSVAVLVGTYTVTSRSVRFNMRLIRTDSNEILSMGTATVPVTEELQPLLADLKGPRKVTPSVGTRLP